VALSSRVVLETEEQAEEASAATQHSAWAHSTLDVAGRQVVAAFVGCCCSTLARWVAVEVGGRVGVVADARYCSRHGSKYLGRVVVEIDW
jgi:hypothetical protein